jgi:PAS domain S-box-containing protein
MIGALPHRIEKLSTASVPANITEPLSWSRRLATAAALLVVALGTTATIGWSIEHPGLIQILPVLPPMTRNTAACFMLSGLALAVLSLDRRRWIAVVAAALVAIVGVLRLVEVAFRVDTGVNEILGPSYINTGLVVRGGMAPGTAICFTLGALALMSTPSVPNVRSALLLGLNGSIVAAFGIAATVGFFGGVALAALHTAVGFLLLGSGLLALGWRVPSDPTPTPRWLPLTVAVGVIAGIFGLWRALTVGGYAAFDLLPVIVLIVGALVAPIFALTVHLAQRGYAQAATLRRNEVELRQIAENIPALVSLHSPTGKVELINRRILDFTGKTMEELQQWSATDLVHPDDLARAIQQSKDGIASGKPYEIIYRMRRHDGVYRWFEAFHTPLREADGRLYRWCVSVNDIDDRKRVEDMLRNSERAWRSVVDGMPGLTATLAPDGAVEAVNRPIIEYTGLQLDELRQWGTNGTVHPDDMPNVGEVFARSIASETPYYIEQRLRRFDGVYRWFSNRGVPAHDVDGRLERWYVLLVDIDERKRAEDALRESERRSRQIVDSIPGLVAVTSAAGELELVNPQMIDYFGGSFEDQKRWQTSGGTTHPDDHARVVEDFSSAIKSGLPFNLEFRARRRDGSYRWMDSRARPLKDADGRIVNWFHLLIDVDDRKRAEDALRESERKSREIIDTIPAMVAVLTPDGYVERVNERLIDFFGKTREELSQWGNPSLVHPNDVQGAIEKYTRTVATGQSNQIEVRVRRFDGVYRWVESRMFPLRGADGNIINWYNLLVDIHDRRRAEDALRETEEQLRLIVSTIPGFVAVFAANGDPEELNEQFVAYLGQTVEEFAAWPTNGSVHPDDLERHVGILDRSLASGDPMDFETRLRRHDGVYRWFQLRGHAARDADGRIVRWYCLMTDIDDRKRAEDAVSASERNLQQTIDTIPAFAWSSRPDGQADFLNQHYLDFVGLPPEQLLGAGWASRLHPDDLPGLLAIWQDMLETGQPGEAEARLQRHDGEYRWLLFRTNPLRNESGEIVKWYGINTDIEDRKRAEAELRRSHDSFAAAQRLSKTGNFTADVVVDEHIWSDEMYRIFEIEIGKKISVQDVRGVLHPEDLPTFDAGFQRSAAEGVDFDQVFRIVTPVGGLKHLHAKARVFEKVENRPVFVGAIRDVTESRLAEEALNTTRSELAYVARVTALSTLSASIAHEVNQPLSGIITNASTGLRMLATDPPNIEGARETARRTIRDGNRAAEVITRLRALFSNKMAATERVDLNEATRDVIALSRAELQRKGIELAFNPTGDLPVVTGDRVQLQQVILNLLLNACDALDGVKDRQRRITITTGLDEDDDVRLTVRDTGTGISPAVADRLFDAFYTTKESGMGIGLSVSRSIIERHQGRIWASVNEPPGASFSFALPRNAGTDTGNAGTESPVSGT